MTASAITAKHKPRCEDLRWVTAAVLAALAARGYGQGATFTSAELREWIPKFKEEARLSNATSKLTKLGFVTYRQRMVEGGGDIEHVYTLTKQGHEAIKLAAAGKVHKSGPKGPHTAFKTVPANSFTFRLWALMRARKLLDAETAASTLVDAGDDVKKATQTANKYLRRWTQLGNLAESAQRVNAAGTSNGFKRYVLINDCGPTPPAWTAKALARKAATTKKQS